MKDGRKTTHRNLKKVRKNIIGRIKKSDYKIQRNGKAKINNIVKNIINSINKLTQKYKSNLKRKNLKDITNYSEKNLTNLSVGDYIHGQN